MSKFPYQNVILQTVPGGGWEITGAEPTKSTTEPVKPVSKGGRPKGPDKAKKTFYLTTDLSVFNQIKLDLAGNARVLVKDESDTVDFALGLLATLAADPSKADYLQNFNKKRSTKR